VFAVANATLWRLGFDRAEALSWATKGLMWLVWIVAVGLVAWLCVYYFWRETHSPLGMLALSLGIIAGWALLLKVTEGVDWERRVWLWLVVSGTVPAAMRSGMLALLGMEPHRVEHPPVRRPGREPKYSPVGGCPVGLMPTGSLMRSDGIRPGSVGAPGIRRPPRGSSTRDQSNGQDD
jgi:hypothetical protein